MRSPMQIITTAVLSMATLILVAMFIQVFAVDALMTTILGAGIIIGGAGAVTVWRS